MIIINKNTIIIQFPIIQRTLQIKKKTLKTLSLETSQKHEKSC